MRDCLIDQEILRVTPLIRRQLQRMHPRSTRLKEMKHGEGLILSVLGPISKRRPPLTGSLDTGGPAVHSGNCRLNVLVIPPEVTDRAVAISYDSEAHWSSWV